jgi:carbon storage regulator CsrA
MALTISRKQGETVLIGNAVVTIKSVRGGNVKVSIEAPTEMKIRRGELEPNEGKAA